MPFMSPFVRGYHTIERAAAFPIATASVRIFFILASGANGLPLWMPIDANKPRVSASSMSSGSFSITLWRCS
jgi:hypothetical protein